MAARHARHGHRLQPKGLDCVCEPTILTPVWSTKIRMMEEKIVQPHGNIIAGAFHVQHPRLDVHRCPYAAASVIWQELIVDFKLENWRGESVWGKNDYVHESKLRARGSSQHGIAWTSCSRRLAHVGDPNIDWPSFESFERCNAPFVRRHSRSAHGTSEAKAQLQNNMYFFKKNQQRQKKTNVFFGETFWWKTSVRRTTCTKVRHWASLLGKDHLVHKLPTHDLPEMARRSTKATKRWFDILYISKEPLKNLPTWVFDVWLINSHCQSEPFLWEISNTQHAAESKSTNAWPCSLTVPGLNLRSPMSNVPKLEIHGFRSEVEQKTTNRWRQNKGVSVDPKFHTWRPGGKQVRAVSGTKQTRKKYQQRIASIRLRDSLSILTRFFSLCDNWRTCQASPLGWNSSGNSWDHKRSQSPAINQATSTETLYWTKRKTLLWSDKRNGQALYTKRKI